MRADLALHDHTTMAAYRQRAAVREARQLDEWYRARAVEAVWLRYRLLSAGDLTRVGNALADFDREIRRAAAIVSAPWADRGIPRPMSVRTAGLRVSGARAGSLDLLLQGVGGVATILLSDPIQLLLTTQALLGNTARIRVWWARRSDITRRVSLHDGLKIYEAIDDFLRERSAELPDELEPASENEAVEEPPNRGSDTPTRPRRRPREASWQPRAADDAEPDVEIILDGDESRSPHELMLLAMDDQETVYVVEATEDW